MIKKFLKWLDKILWSKEIKYLHRKSYEGCFLLFTLTLKTWFFGSCIYIWSAIFNTPRQLKEKIVC